MLVVIFFIGLGNSVKTRYENRGVKQSKYRMWVKIFTSMDEARQRVLLNTPQLLLIGEHRITLVQTRNGFVAVQDFCTHNKESLSKGTVNFRDEIICPWHGHCFDLRTGRESKERSADLKTYAVRENEEGLFIDL